MSGPRFSRVPAVFRTVYSVRPPNDSRVAPSVSFLKVVENVSHSVLCMLLAGSDSTGLRGKGCVFLPVLFWVSVLSECCPGGGGAPAVLASSEILLRA